jgi:hypothetical protein
VQILAVGDDDAAGADLRRLHEFRLERASTSANEEKRVLGKRRLLRSTSLERSTCHRRIWQEKESLRRTLSRLQRPPKDGRRCAVFLHL